jgi:hypothetical protein
VGKRQYAVHRWLAAIAGIQLFLWSLGGFIFATHDIGWVRGEDRTNPSPEPPVAVDQVRIAPAEAVVRADVEKVERIELRSLLGAPVYEIHHAGGVALIDAHDGAARSPIGRDDAEAIARNDRVGEPVVQSVALIEADPPTEYRGRPLPAWKIALDDGEGTHIYVAAATGRVTARRNDAWRRFDFFWMLHTMDYGGRDDFNHPLLIGAAGLGLITVLSGWLLWGARIVRRIRRRRR